MHNPGRSPTGTLATRSFSSSTEGSSRPLIMEGASNADRANPAATARQNRECSIPNNMASHRLFSSAHYLFGSNIQRVNQDWIIFIVVGCECEIVICSSEVGLQRHRRDELPLSLWRLLLPQQSLAKPIMQLRLIRMRNQQGAVGGFGQVIFPSGHVRVREIALGRIVARRQLKSGLQF